MPKKQSKDEIKEGARNLLDKIGTSGEGFSVFFGAGASKCADLPTMAELAEILEAKLGNCDNREIIKLLGEIIGVLKLETSNGITIEQILEMLYHIQFLMEKREDKISVHLGELGTIKTENLISAVDFIKNIIWEECYTIEPMKLKSHIDFFEWFMGESGRIRRLNVFTTNWDFGIEISCDTLKFRCVDGFVGIFNGFEKFSLFTETQSEQLRTIYLHKLHGSLNWVLDEQQGELRKKINWNEIDSCDTKSFMIYPIPSKTKEILGYPYAELISRFSDALLKQDYPLLLVIGYNLTDSHVVTKISSMLENNEHSNLFIVDPNLKLDRLSAILGFSAEKDARIILLQTGFTEFTEVLKELS